MWLQFLRPYILPTETGTKTTHCFIQEERTLLQLQFKPPGGNSSWLGFGYMPIPHSIKQIFIEYLHVSGTVLGPWKAGVNKNKTKQWTGEFLLQWNFYFSRTDKQIKEGMDRVISDSNNYCKYNKMRWYDSEQSCGCGGGGKLRWVAEEGFPEVTPEVRWMK